MKKKLKIDPKKVKYDGHSFRLIIDDEAALLEKLKKKQAEIIKDLEGLREPFISDHCTTNQRLMAATRKIEDLEKELQQKNTKIAKALEILLK